MTTTAVVPDAPIVVDRLARIRQYIFRRMLQVMDTAKTGHLGACCSSIDLMVALYFDDILRYDTADPKHPYRDYVLNRGHLGPLKYTIASVLGWIADFELDEYRKYGSRLAGHEDMKLTPGIDISPNGSLGMLLSYAVGACIGFRDARMPNRMWCFIGDGEEQEGNVAEAARHAGHLQIPNLIAVIDKNGAQLSTRVQRTDSARLASMWESYGWTVLHLYDGHDLSIISRVYRQAIELAAYGPVLIIARTVKGYGIPGAENDYCGYHVYHGGSEPGETVRHVVNLQDVIATLPQPELPEIQQRFLRLRAEYPTEIKPVHITPRIAGIAHQEPSYQVYDIEQDVLLELKRQLGDRLYLLTSDYPPRCFVYGGALGGASPLTEQNYYNVGIREQHMTAMAHGLMQARPNALVVMLCGDAFLYRHMDQLNALCQGETRVILYSVQGGLSGARNGETHQSSGQPGALLTMPGMTLEEPCTVADFVRATNRALARLTPTVIRLQKLRVPYTYNLGEFEVSVNDENRGYEFWAASHDRRDRERVFVCAGMTTIEVMEAVRQLHQAYQVNWAVVNITCLTDCAGFSEFIAMDSHVECYYNGNADVLAAVVLKELNRGNVHARVCAHGFNFGVTGGIGDLLRHFKMDASSIVDHVHNRIA